MWVCVRVRRFFGFVRGVWWVGSVVVVVVIVVVVVCAGVGGGEG